MQPPVIFVVGPVRHGKTTTRELVCQATGLSGGSCSDVIYHVLAVRRGVSVESLRQLPKEAIRPALIEVGDFLCGAIGQLSEVPVNASVDQDVFRHPSSLIRTLYMNGRNVIDGVRRRLELQDAREHLEWNGVRSLTIHVEDPRKERIADNSEDLRDLADEHIVNDGTPEELRAKVIEILTRHFAPAQPEPGVVVSQAPAPVEATSPAPTEEKPADVA